jgi:hypothetical protein
VCYTYARSCGFDTVAALNRDGRCVTWKCPSGACIRNVCERNPRVHGMAPASRCRPLGSLQEGRRACSSAGTCEHLRLKNHCTVLVWALPVHWRSARAGRQSATLTLGGAGGLHGGLRVPSRRHHELLGHPGARTPPARARRMCDCCGAALLRTLIQRGRCTPGRPLRCPAVVARGIHARSDSTASYPESAPGMRDHPRADQRTVQLQHGAGAVALQPSHPSALAPPSAVPAVTGCLPMAPPPPWG